MIKENMKVLAVLILLTVISANEESLTKENLSPQNQKSIKNYYGCKIWQDGVCIQCATRFYFNDDGICCEVDPQCQIFNTNIGKCEGCYNGYEQVDGECVVINTLGFQSRGCRNFENGICIECSFRFYLYKNQACRRVNDLCRTWDEQSGDCQSCYGGYVLDEGRCIISAQFFRQNRLCAKFEDQVCVNCAVRAFFNSEGICEEVNPFCKTYDNFDGKCLSCFRGYEQNDGVCIWSLSNTQAPPNLGCKQFDLNDGSCLQCLSDWKKNGKLCIPNADPDLCINRKQDNMCMECFKGYEVKDGKCIWSASSKIQKQQTKQQEREIIIVQQTTKSAGETSGSYSRSSSYLDPGCRRFDENDICIECSFRFQFDENQVCRQVNDLCRTWNKKSRDCQSCYGGYVLDEGRCFMNNHAFIDSGCHKWDWNNIICEKCSFRFVMIDQQCVQVSDLCEKWNYLGECTSCYGGYILRTGDCVLGNPLCKKEQETGGCLSCYGGYILEGKECLHLSEVVKHRNVEKDCCKKEKEGN